MVLFNQISFTTNYLTSRSQFLKYLFINFRTIRISGEYKQTVRAGIHIKTHEPTLFFFSFIDQLYIREYSYTSYNNLYPFNIHLCRNITCFASPF